MKIAPHFAPVSGVWRLSGRHPKEHISPKPPVLFHLCPNTHPNPTHHPELNWANGASLSSRFDRITFGGDCRAASKSQVSSHFPAERCMINGVSIIFVHGLGGHPQNTWSAKVSSSDASSAERKTSGDTIPTARKGSVFNTFFKRSKTGTPIGLGDRSMSIAQSTHTMETISDSLSPSETSSDLMPEPELMLRLTAGTARSRSDKIFWPRDLLPKDFPSARIFTFGYDADLVSMTSTGARAKLSFSQHAHDLMMTLNLELDDDVCT